MALEVTGARGPASGHATFERAAVAAAAAVVVYFAARYDVCFQDAEAVADYLFDEGERGRILSFAAYIVTLETRLALWHLVPPHPSFSPVWLLTLGAGPVLLYRFLRLELDSVPAALAGAAVYLVSAGCLSGVTMLFHQGKPIVNVCVIAALYLCARLRRVWSPASAAALLMVLVAAPLFDETGAFAFAIPLLWCPAVFRRKAALAGYAAACGVVVIAYLVLVPGLFEARGGSFDLAEYLRQMSEEGARHDKFDVLHVVWQAGNLLIPALLPWELAQVRTPVADAPRLPVAALAGLAGLLLAVSLGVYRRRTQWLVYRRLGLLTTAFVVFQSIVLVFHPLELTATGFYYGALFSVLFASGVSAVYASALQASSAWTTGLMRGALVWLLAIAALNFSSLNASWMAHSHAKALELLPTLAVTGYGSDMSLLQADAARHAERASRLAPDGLEASYVNDITAPPDPFDDVLETWRAWRRGEPEFLAVRPRLVPNLWLAVELDRMTRTEPRPWWAVLHPRPDPERSVQP